MHEFAREQDRSLEVQRNLADLFSLAESFFNYWTDQDKERWTEAIPRESANLALILDVQASRLYRSIVEECRRAEAFNAAILARTLFETVLGVAFLLKKDVRIVVEPIVPKGASSGALPAKFAAKVRSRRTKRTRRHLLTREFRATLFLAYAYFSLEEQGIESMGKFPGFYHKARRLRKTTDRNIIAEYERQIGAEWSYILRHSNTYAGLAVEDLAAVLHKEFLRWYETVYHFQSLAVHALDVLHHIEIADGQTLTASFLSNDRDVYQSLRAATGIFYAHMHIVHQNIGFGTSADVAFYSLGQKLKRVTYKGE